MVTTMNEQLAGWAAGTRRSGFQRRNWLVVRRLAAVTAVLMLASLPAEFALGSRTLTVACWMGAALAGAAMFAWLRDSRRFVMQSPVSHS